MKNKIILIFGILVAIAICNTRFQEFSRLGLGFEESRNHRYHPGDSGMVAVFHNYHRKTIASTDGGWKAQAFYPALKKDFSCPTKSEQYETLLPEMHGTIIYRPIPQ